MKKLPAVVIGGPPHSGKSVLTYSLTQALRRQQVDHLVVRACPDGEGDWTHETPPETVKKIRNKGAFTPTYVKNICEALPKRLLPLIVDIGGRISDEQRAICQDCTHIILVAANPDDLVAWRSFANELQLTVIAELHSTLVNEDDAFAHAPVFRGRISGLERNQQASGPVFERLVWVLRVLFAQPENELRKPHLANAPTTTLEFDRLRDTLDLTGWRWDPPELPALFNILKVSESYALYGRAPNWLYCAVVAHQYPTQLHLFHPLLEWVKPIEPTVRDNAQSAEINYSLEAEAVGLWRLQAKINNDNYLDYESMITIEVPAIPKDVGLILDGELPQWFVTGLICAYHDAPMLAIYQPHVGDIVIKSTTPKWTVGQVIP